MSDIDPIRFGELCSDVKNIHEGTKRIETSQTDIKKKLDNHGDRIKAIETSRKTVTKGVFGLGALYGAWKVILGMFT